MHEVTVTRTMQNNAQAVWKVLDDFGNIYRYNPAVESSNLIGNKATGVGAMRECHFYDGTSLKETITEYHPGQGYGFRLSDFSLPLKEASTQLRVEPINNEQSKLTITLKFIPKFGPLGWVMANLMMKPMLNKALTGLAKGLDDHIDTGRIVGKKGTLLEAA
ncbi:MAG: hypothetical protein Tsb002_26800 [Wenzhouxiangellaceae bacterium]